MLRNPGNAVHLERKTGAAESTPWVQCGNDHAHCLQPAGLGASLDMVKPVPAPASCVLLLLCQRGGTCVQQTQQHKTLTVCPGALVLDRIGHATNGVKWTRVDGPVLVRLQSVQHPCSSLIDRFILLP